MKRHNHPLLHSTVLVNVLLYVLDKDRDHREDSGCNSELRGSFKLPGSKNNLREQGFVDPTDIFKVPKILSACEILQE